MKCFECQTGKLVARTAEVQGKVKGEELSVQTEAMVCNRCGAQVLTDAQSAAYTVAVADAYRDRHGLFTSRDLKRIRRRFGLSQRAFARRFRGISLASLKRWEAGAIQDEAHDELLRLKTDIQAARRNLQELEENLGDRTAEPQVIGITVHRPAGAESEWGINDSAKSVAGVTVPPGFFTTCYGA